MIAAAFFNSSEGGMLEPSGVMHRDCCVYRDTRHHRPLLRSSRLGVDGRLNVARKKVGRDAARRSRFSRSCRSRDLTLLRTRHRSLAKELFGTLVDRPCPAAKLASVLIYHRSRARLGFFAAALQTRSHSTVSKKIKTKRGEGINTGVPKIYNNKPKQQYIRSPLAISPAGTLFCFF